MRFFTILKHLPFVFASLWSIGMSIYMPFVPIYSGYSIEYNAGQSEPIEQVSKATLYDVNGPRVIAVLIVFALLYSSTAVLAKKTAMWPWRFSACSQSP